MIKKLIFNKITGARVDWCEEYMAEWGKIAHKEVSKVWFGSMVPKHLKKTWYRPWGIKHELVGDKLANAISNFNFLKNDEI